MDKKRIIYDFGMNNGDDVEYYLRKGCKVVGVEANPKHCNDCLRRFKHPITRGDLVVLNVALSDKSSTRPVRFFVHRTIHTMSQLLEPPAETASNYEEILVPQRKASEIVKDYGEPYYIKIDVEHVDHLVIADLFAASIFPTFISAESHLIDVFCLFVAHGYTFFNLVDGGTVNIKYKNADIQTPSGKQKFSFEYNSAGPFGEDIKSPWMTQDVFFRFLQLGDLGWKDIHATKIRMSNTTSTINMAQFKRQISFRDHMYDLVPSFIRGLKHRIVGRIYGQKRKI
jgi:FkbM family methyltransferase